MNVNAWTALLHAHGTARVVDWRCGDHASEAETELEVKAAAGSIYVTRRTFECQEAGPRGKLIGEEPL